MTNKELLDLPDEPVPENKGFTPDGSAGITLPSAAPLTPSQAAKLKRLMLQFDARCAETERRHRQLAQSGYDYPGREHVRTLMRRLGRA